jgi:V/A-type H+-transporting ATPase subunit C
MKSYMLSRASYERLLRAASMAEVLNVLGDTVYASSVAETDLMSVETSLLRGYYDAHRRIISFAPPDCSALLESMYSRHEYQCLKSILRAIASGMEVEEALKLIAPAGKYTYELSRDLIRSKNISRVIETVEDESLRKALSSTLEEGLPTPALESTIDRHIFLKIWRSTSLLDRWDELSAKRIIGKEIDFLNMTTVLRGHLMNLEPSTIQKLLIPVEYRLGVTLKRAAEARSAFHALQVLAGSDYGHLLSPFMSAYKEGETIFPIEVIFKRYLSRECLAMFEGYPFVAGLIIAFLYLKSYEISDLKAILNGKLAQLSPDTIRDFLILY